MPASGHDVLLEYNSMLKSKAKNIYPSFQLLHCYGFILHPLTFREYETPLWKDFSLRKSLLRSLRSCCFINSCFQSYVGQNSWVVSGRSGTFSLFKKSLNIAAINFSNIQIEDSSSGKSFKIYSKLIQCFFLCISFPFYKHFII